MATIKIPYTYTSYPFSPKATKYSDRLSRNRHGTGVFAGLFSWVPLAFLCYALFPDASGDATTILLFICLLASIYIGVKAEQLRTNYLKRKVREALEEDLKPFENYDSEFVRSVKSHIEAELCPFVSYPSSPLATKYSRRLSQNKLLFGIYSGVFSGVILAMFSLWVASLFPEKYKVILFIILISAGVGVAIYIGMNVEERRTEYLESKIKDALDLDREKVMCPARPTHE